MHDEDLAQGPNDTYHQSQEAASWQNNQGDEWIKAPEPLQYPCSAQLACNNEPMGRNRHNTERKSKAQKYNVEWVKIKVENHNGEAKKKKKKETKTTQAGRTSPQIKAIDQIVQRNDPKPLPDTLKT